MFRILLTEDNREYRKQLQKLLQTAGYDPIPAANGAEALDILERRHIDLMLTDVTMPKMDGFELLTQLRGTGSKLPVIIVSARADQEDICRGLRLGADDYVVKPVGEEELLLRIAGLLRRANAVTEHTLTVGSTSLVFDSFQLQRGDTAIELPRKEFLLLYKLLANPNKTFTRRQLMDEIWDLDTESDEHTVVVHINRLRSRIQDNPDFAIKTIRGLGYKAVRLN